MLKADVLKNIVAMNLKELPALADIGGQSRALWYVAPNWPLQLLRFVSIPILRNFQWKRNLFKSFFGIK